MSTAATSQPFRTLDDAANLRDNDVMAYYLSDLKFRVAVTRVGDTLYAFDDIYDGHSLSAGLISGTTLMSQCDGSQFDVQTGAVLRGPATEALGSYEARERDGKIEVQI